MPPIPITQRINQFFSFAHQGGAKEGPSSTLFAMQNAILNGAHALELDVHCTLDGTLVVGHDSTVDRTTNGIGKIANLTLAELKALDNAYWFVEGVGDTREFESQPEKYIYRGRHLKDSIFKIPTLSEVLDAFPDVYLNLDIKETEPEVPGYEKLLAELLVKHDAVHRTIVASFNDFAMSRFKTFLPEATTSAPTGKTLEFYQAYRSNKEPEGLDYVALQVPLDFQGKRVINEDLITFCHKMNVKVHVWTIDEENDMEYLLKCGADGIFTDLPSVLTRCLNSFLPSKEA